MCTTLQQDGLLSMFQRLPFETKYRITRYRYILARYVWFENILDLVSQVLVTCSLCVVFVIVIEIFVLTIIQYIHVLVAPVAPSLENVVSSQVAKANPHGLGKLYTDRSLYWFFHMKTSQRSFFWGKRQTSLKQPKEKLPAY